MRKHLSRRILSILLTVTMLLGLAAPAGAAGSKKQRLAFEPIGTAVDSPQKLGDVVADEDFDAEQEEYEWDDVVRVSIVLDNASTIERFGSVDHLKSFAAVAYRENLKTMQERAVSEINEKLDEAIDVVWNLTLAANIVSANVRYDQIAEIETLSCVKEVVIEERYEIMTGGQNEKVDPNMGISTEQIGSAVAWAAGYTGAGSKIAVIDTGVDTEHEAFDGAGYNYSMAINAENAGKTLEEYKDLVGVMTKSDLTADVLGKLNVNVSADKVYLSDKIPFAYNYVDDNYHVDHLYDTEGDHGSHVAGIAVANRYVLDEATNEFEFALDSTKVQGVAPDAQLIVMKVFGAGGGAYDSDYMAAIEDAVVLGADSINLSLGSGNPGFSRSDTYQELLDNLTTSGVSVVCMSAGNSSYWAKKATPGYLYAEDVSMQMDGSPGSFTNAFTVANVANDGFTGNYFTIGDKPVFYTEPNYTNEKLTTIAGTYDYLILPAGVAGTAEDFANIDATGKIVFVQRGGGLSFYVKAENAIAAGAIATVIYNNAAGSISMSLTGYTKTNPCVAITQADGLAIIDASTKAEDGDYYTGTMTVKAGIDSVKYDAEYYTMSASSSWGVPGSLELKPEITAPGENIYSVFGTSKGDDGSLTGGTKQYTNKSGTSMASPQVAGMAALLGQYIRETGLAEKTGKSVRTLINSLLMSTAEPIIDGNTTHGTPYSVLNQGAGLANVGNALNAKSYILMGDNVSGTAADGKVKAEFGDDPEKTGVYEFDFNIYNISGEAQEYTFSADLFTQDLFTSAYNEVGAYATYMDILTTPLMAYADFDVTGADYTTPEDAFQCDVNYDGVTDDKDVQYILDYVTGKVNKIADIADLNSNSMVDSNDAYILLKKMSTATIIVPAADEPVSVHVTITLTADQKAALNANYPNGAYVEGYVYVETVTDSSETEGEDVIAHSIPMLGFYGNWSDASAIDTSTYLEKLYGTVNDGYYKPSYLDLYDTNYLTVKYHGDKKGNIYTINPYIVEDEIPYERAAITSDSAVGTFTYSLIRNAAAVVKYFKNETTGEVTADVVQNQLKSAYYYSNGSAWRNTFSSTSFNVKPATLEVEEGQVFTIGLVFIPEYYEIAGTITDEQALQIIQSGVLGEGAYFTNTFTVDNTAPEALEISKDIETGALTVVAKDNQYVSSICVFNRGGKEITERITPEQTGANESCSLTFPMDDSVGEYVTVVVTDYAGNEMSYRVNYGGTPADFTGQVFAFTAGTRHGSGQRWVEIDPATLSAAEGMDEYFAVDYEVYAADYVGGYVFYAAADGFYAAHQEELNSPAKLASFAFESADEMVAAMSFNDKNGTMYVLTNSVSSVTTGALSKAGNKLYTLDLSSGQLTKVADISLTAGAAAVADTTLRTMAVDDAGNFYAFNGTSGTSMRFYTWTLDSIVEGALALEPVDTFEPVAGMYATGYCALAYDSANEVLYFGAGTGTKNATSTDVNFYTFSTAGELLATKASNENVVGLYVVSDTATLPDGSGVTSIELSDTQMTVLKGTTRELTATVYPWNAADKSVTWTSSDPEIVSVENGVFKALAVGEATITAASVVNPAVTATCKITVEPLPNIKLSGLVYDTDGETYWADFETNDLTAWTKISEVPAGKYCAGALHEGELVVHDGSYVFAIDPDEFTVKAYSSGINSTARWSDAAAAPEVNGIFGRLAAVCNNGTYFILIDPVTANYTYWNCTSWLGAEQMAVLAFTGTSTYTTGGVTYPANYYYMMAESGKLWKFAVYSKNGGTNYSLVRWSIGDTGLDLSGVSAVTGGQYGSMVYDQETGYLLISAYLEGKTAALYAVDPDVLIPAEVGTFGDGVCPVVSLYQYDRLTDLTLKVDTTSAEMYVGDSVTVNARVILGETKELVWTSSDESIATVENGVITGTGAGTATVTVTTVDTNLAGETISADIAVTVKPTASASATINAQVTTVRGSEWVSIDLDTMTTTTIAKAETQLYGGGYSDGSLYGTDVYSEKGYMYSVNPETYEEECGPVFSTTWAVRDLAEFKDINFTLTASDGTVYEKTLTTDAFYIANNGRPTRLSSYSGGTVSSWDVASKYPGLAAIAYVGDSTLAGTGRTRTDCDPDTTVHIYYALSADGTLRQLDIVPTYNVSKGTVGSTMYTKTVGTVGITFSDLYAASMEYITFSEDNYGLIVSVATTGSFYYINLAGEGVTYGKIGDLDDVTWISCLHNANAKPASPEAIAHIIEMSDRVAVEASVEEVAVEETTFEAPVNAVVGGVNAVSIQAEPQTVKPSEGGMAYNAMQVTIRDDEVVTNGKYTVTYDPAQLTFVSYTSPMQFNSLNNDAEKGEIVFAFASEEPMEANSICAVLNFACADGVDAKDVVVTVTTNERNENTAVEGDMKFIGGEHVWDDGVVTKEATCTEPGEMICTCKDCGETLVIVIPAIGHTTKVVNAKAPTCTQPGYTGDLVCETCGEIVESGKIIPATGHLFYGNTCTGCGELLSDPTVIPGSGTGPVTPVTKLPFVDVKPTDSFYDAVKYIYEKGIMIGISDTVFGVNVELNRAMVATILYRIEGEPAVDFQGTFSDIKPSDYCAEAVEWAAANGIARGFTDGTFKPNQAVTLEQLAAFISRYAEFKGITIYETTLSEDASVSKWAEDNVAWAAAEGILTTEQVKRATQSAKRAEVAEAVYTFVSKTVK